MRSALPTASIHVLPSPDNFLYLCWFISVCAPCLLIFEGVQGDTYSEPHRPPHMFEVHDIHADVVRAHVIHAHDIHVDSLDVRTVYEGIKEPKGPKGARILKDKLLKRMGSSLMTLRAHIVEASTKSVTIHLYPVSSPNLPAFGHQFSHGSSILGFCEGLAKGFLIQLSGFAQLFSVLRLAIMYPEQTNR